MLKVVKGESAAFGSSGGLRGPLCSFLNTAWLMPASWMLMLNYEQITWSGFFCQTMDIHKSLYLYNYIGLYWIVWDVMQLYTTVQHSSAQGFQTKLSATTSTNPSDYRGPRAADRSATALTPQSDIQSWLPKAMSNPSPRLKKRCAYFAQVLSLFNTLFT